MKSSHEVKIAQANYKAIEAELYVYFETKKELELMGKEILESTPNKEVVVQSGKAVDSTVSKAIKVACSMELLEARKRIDAIEKTLLVLQQDEIKLDLLRMKYFDRRYTDVEMQQKLNISRETFYRWRREIVELVGSYLGWRV